MSKILLKLIFLLMLIACNQKENEEKKFNKYPSNTKNLLFNYYIKPIQEYLNLYSIDDGVDSFEVRIYVSYALTSKEDLYLIKATKDSLIKSHYYFIPQIKYYPDGTISKFENNFAYMKKFSFLCKDTCFITLFDQSKISSLPTQDSIKNLDGGCTDGVGYTIEIATKNSYRLINYGNPICFEKSEENVNFGTFINKFLSIIKEETFPRNYTISYLISD
jgi:hypothetical protein